MQGDVGLSIAQGGWLASANYAGYLVGALWATFHRVDSAFAIRASLIATAVATLSMAAVDGMPAWLALRFLAGVASAWAFIHISAWCLDRLAPARRPLLGGVVFSGVGAGIVLAGLSCLALMLLGASHQAAWLALGSISFLVAWIVWPIFQDGRESTRAMAPEIGFHWTGDAVRLVLCYGALGFGYIIPATFLPAMARQLIPDPRVFGWAWPMFGAAACASTIIVIALIGRKPNRSIWRLGSLVMACGVIGPIVVPGLAGMVVAALLVGGTLIVISMVGVQEAREIAGPQAGILVAAMTSAFAAGQAVGPLLVSALAGNAGFSAPLWTASAVLAVSALSLGRRPSPALSVARSQ